jgi:mycothiol synthase
MFENFEIRWWDEENGVRVYLHETDPEAAEARVLELAQQHGTVSRAVIGANAVEPTRAQLLLDNGYEQVFSLVVMELDGLSKLPEAKLEAGVVVREASQDDLRPLWELNNVAYAGRDFVGVATEEGFAAFRDRAKDLSLYTVAGIGDDAVAFVSSEIAGVSSDIDGDFADVTEVTVHTDYRRRGFATALLSLNLASVRERGIDRARLHTNGEDVSGARSLYSKFGFVPVETRLRFRKPLNATSG